MLLVEFCCGCKLDVEYAFGEDGMWEIWNLFCGCGVGEGIIVNIRLARRIIDRKYLFFFLDCQESLTYH